MSDKLQSILKDIRDNFADVDSLIDEYSRIYGATPEDILIENEARQRILEFLPVILDSLDATDREIIELTIVDGWTQDAIAIKLGMSQSAVAQRIDKIPEKIKKKFDGFTYNLRYIGIYYEDFFGDYFKIPDRHGQLTSFGYPHDLLKSISDDGYWGKSQFKPIYKSKTKCVLKDYFTQSFGDNKTVCTLCSKCTEKA